MNAGKIIRSWRKIRELSQADVAARCGLSTRHMSFIETGRANPSAAVLRNIANAIVLPRSEFDKLMLAAGHAPDAAASPYATDKFVPAVRDLLGERLEVVSDEVMSIHKSIPACRVDGAWDVQHQTKIFGRFVSAFASVQHMQLSKSKNLMHLLFHPSGFGSNIIEWPHMSAILMLMLRKDSVGKHYSDPVHALIGEISKWADDQDGEEILEPYELSALGLTIHIRAGDTKPLKFLFTTFCFAAPFSALTRDTKFAIFFPQDEAAEGWIDTRCR